MVVSGKEFRIVDTVYSTGATIKVYKGYFNFYHVTQVRSLITTSYR